MDKIKILAVAYTYYESDPRVIRASEAMERQGNTVEFLCLRRPQDPTSEERNGVKVVHLPLQRFRGDNQFLYILNYLAFFALVSIYISLTFFQQRWHVIHIHNMPEFLVFTTVLPKIFGSRIILDMHDLMPETFATKFDTGSVFLNLMLFIEKRSLAYSDHVITVHDVYRDILISRKVPPGKITVVMNLPDLEIFYPRATNRFEKFTIIYHGIVAHRQGLDLVLKALALLKQEDLPLRFLVIGEGDALPGLRQLCAELGLQAMFEVIEPYLPVTEIPDYLSSSHLGIIPYRESEATHFMLPVKLLEYVAMEIPVISSRLNVVTRYFDERMLCYIPFENIEALAKAVRELYHSEELRLDLVKEARKFTETYNWRKEQIKVISAYEKVMMRSVRKSSLEGIES